MPKLKKAAFWVVAGLLMLVPVVLAELYLRSIGLGNPILFYANASYRFAPLPNQQQVRQRGAKVSIDSKGLRNSADWSDPADGKLLFIGDSVTWGGTYIDDRQLFSDGVCQRLAAATGKRYICGNAGANQYGTDNMAERIRYANVNDESVLVVTLIAADAIRGRVDAEGRYFFMQRPPPPFRALWEATTFLTWVLYKKLRPQSYRVRRRFAGRRAQRGEHAVGHPRDAAAGPEGADRLVAHQSGIEWEGRPVDEAGAIHTGPLRVRLDRSSRPCFQGGDPGFLLRRGASRCAGPRPLRRADRSAAQGASRRRAA